MNQGDFATGQGRATARKLWLTQFTAVSRRRTSIRSTTREFSGGSRMVNHTLRSLGRYLMLHVPVGLVAGKPECADPCRTAATSDTNRHAWNLPGYSYFATPSKLYPRGSNTPPSTWASSPAARTTPIGTLRGGHLYRPPERRERWACPGFRLGPIFRYPW